MADTIEHTPHKLGIVDRREIAVPSGYVLVYHETTPESMPLIDKQGLRYGKPGRSSGLGSGVQRYNMWLDQDRPQHLKDLGVSRVNSIYAYPFLEQGNDLGAAAERFKQRLRKRDEHDRDFADHVKYGGGVLAAMGITTADEYAQKMADPAYLRQKYPDGEVLELAVDPTKCFVSDMYKMGVAYEDLARFGYKDGALAYVWEGVVTLADFLKWYKKVEDDGDWGAKEPEQFHQPEWAYPGRYHLLAGAPENLPLEFTTPEVMITENIPPEHIRVLE